MVYASYVLCFGLFNSNFGSMSTINSSTTGHSRPGERNFAKKLFIGLIILVIAAFAISFFVGQKRDLRPAGVGGASAETPSANSPEAPQNQQTQPKN